jgi:hypothetical protein
MKRIYQSTGLILFSILIIFMIGCASKTGADVKKDDVKKDDRQVITDPNGVVLEINGMPVTKAELDEAVEKLKPEPKVGLFRALGQHFMPLTAIQAKFPKELEELKTSADSILAEIKSGKITFEDAVLKYSEDPGKDTTKGVIEGYGTGSGYYTIDQVITTLKEGEISDPIVTPSGIAIIKIDKINSDINGDFVSADFKQILLTLSKYLEEGKDINMELQDLVMKTKVEFVDMSLAKEIPELYFLNVPQDKYEEEQKKFDSIPEPEKNWRETPPDSIVMKLNDVGITVGELKKVSTDMMPSKRDVYNLVITNYFKQNLAMIGYFKDKHEEIRKQLNDIKAEIESGKITFDEAVDKYSTDPGKEKSKVYTGITEGQFVPQFEKVAFALPLNKISEPFFSQYGGHICKVVAEKLDDAGKRISIDVQHVLLGFEKFVDQTDPNAMYQIRMKVQDETEIKVYDAYLNSLLPKLSEKPKPKPQPVQPSAQVQGEGANPESPENIEKPSDETKPVEKEEGK